jgi:hypothetical protein
VDISDLPADVQRGACVQSNGEVHWRDDEAAEAIEAIAALGHRILGLDVRFYDADSRFYEIALSSSSAKDPSDAKTDALRALARIDDQETPEGTVERRVLIAWQAGT